MLLCLSVKTLLLLACVVDVRSQYFDIFQGLQALIQPYQTNNYQNFGRTTTTKRPHNKAPQNVRRNYDSSFILFEDDVTTKPRTTTSRPRKTTRRTTANHKTESTTRNYLGISKQNQYQTSTQSSKQYYDSSAIVFLDDQERVRNHTTQDNRGPINNENRKIFNNNFARPQKTVQTNYDVAKNQKQQTKVINYDRSTEKNSKLDFGFTTRKPTTKSQVKYNTDTGAYNNPSDRTTPNNRYEHRNPVVSNNVYNKQNPLVNQVGVRPANVDESEPPITNRPATNSFPNNGGADPNDDYEEPFIEIGPNEEDMTQSEKRRYLELAEQVCNEYKARTVKKVVALPLLPSAEGLAVNVSDCTPINIPLIIGGVVSPIQDFPHMALIGWKRVEGGYSWKCGGSLISSQFVLTAGHCTFFDKDNTVYSGPPYAVQLGSTVLNDPQAVVVRVESVIRHPKYKVRRVYHDVALMKLVHEVPFSEVIRPACLGTPPGVGERVVATGWGRTEFAGDRSRELRSVSIPIWDMRECREVWGTSLKLPNGPAPDNQLCAGERSGQGDTCQGDSGGPLQVQEGCVWRVVAVTSHGRSCGAPLTPALYARIPIPFVAAAAFHKRAQTKIEGQYNSGQNKYSTTGTYEGYQNDGVQNNYNQPNYNSNQQGYDNQPNYSRNNQNDWSTQINNQNQPNYERNPPIYTNNQQNYNNQHSTSNYDVNLYNYKRNQPNYGGEQTDYNQNRRNYNNQEDYDRYQPNYNSESYESQPYYNRNQQNYYGNNYDRANYNQPNYEENYRIPDAARQWWTL